MRFHGGVLFVCGDEATDGYSLAYSLDGGDRLQPMMSVRDITGPLQRCAGDASVSAVCGPVWAQFAPQLQDLDAAASPPRTPLPRADAGPGDAAAPVDARSDAPGDSAGTFEAGVSLDVSVASDTSVPMDLPSPSDLSPTRDVPARKDAFAVRDAGTALDAGVAAPRGGCDCGVPVGLGQTSSGWCSVALAALALRPRRGRRRAGR
jgi:hypothetical protein